MTGWRGCIPLSRMRQSTIVVGTRLYACTVSVGSGRRTDGGFRTTRWTRRGKRGGRGGRTLASPPLYEGGGADSIGKGLATS